MNKQRNNWKSGFTVIELMIVLMIVAILVALAYPSYVDYVRKARRGEAQQLLMNWSINQEIWRSNNPTYADVDDLPAPTHDFYTFDISGHEPGVCTATTDPPTATTFIVVATATGDQVNDTAKGDCTLLTLCSTGAKSPAVCWGGAGS